MLGEEGYTDVKIMLLAVGSYVLEQKKQPGLKLESQFIMDNFIHSLRILQRHQNGNKLLLDWYSQNEHNHHLKDNIHLFVDELWADLAKDRVYVKAIADEYFHRCVWEFIFGTILFVASPTAIVLLLPLLANPASLALVFIVTCILIPVFAHIKMISPGVEHWNASQALDQVVSDIVPNPPGKRPFRDVFFKEGESESVKLGIGDPLNNAACI